MKPPPKPDPIDATKLADGRPCWRCGRPVFTIIVIAHTNIAYETCSKGHRQ